MLACPGAGLAQDTVPIEQETLPSADARAENPTDRRVDLGELLPRSDEAEGHVFMITDKPAASTDQPGRRLDNRPAEQRETLTRQAETQPPPEMQPQNEPGRQVETPEQPEAPQFQANDRLAIPPDAAANNDLSFLQGCWIAKSTACSDPAKPTIDLYCFDMNGRGTRTVIDQHGRGDTYCGGLQASFDSQGRLLIIVERTNTVNARYYCKEQVTCTNTGRSLLCLAKGLERHCCLFGQSYPVSFHRK